MKILSKLLGAASAAVILAAVPAFVPSLSPVVTASAANEAGALLSGKDKELYDELKTFVTEIANGTRTDTTFYYTAPEFLDGSSVKTHFDYEAITALGITPDSSMLNNFEAKVNELYNFDEKSVVDSLLADCPYELFWFDKTAGNSYGCNYGVSGTIGGNDSSIDITSGSLTYSLSFAVSSVYQDGNNSTVLSSKVNAAKTAKSAANTIVSNHSSESDYDKLHSYMNEICTLVDYANPIDYSNGDLWQMINVFDGNSSTNAVCEGYSKAFKYLCDNSSWSSSVNCYLVTGKLSSEDHMWNIVTIGSDAYLVDVTNSDGLPSGSTPLFLRGGTRSSDSYTFSRGGSDKLTFTYDSDTTSLWSSSGILTLATSDYKAPAELEIKHSLTLGDDIGVNFYVKNWTDADAYMTFTVNGKNTTDNGSVYNDMQKFTCTVNSLEMGMDISAVYHYSGGTKSETYSVSQYINEVNANPSNFDATTVKLANATADYGHYVQQYLFELHPGISGNYTAMSNKNTLDSSDISNAKSGLSSSNYDLIRDSSGSGIENVTFSLYLDAKTSIYLYLNPAERGRVLLRRNL